MYTADVVLGGGGTMTREAALLGTPTFSVFAGAPAAVDDSLLRAGRLRRLERVDDLAAVNRRLEPPAALGALQARADTLLDLFVDTVSETAASSRRAG
jgi:predicted glycosyltransferase